MASDREAETLRKQIDVLSNLIHSQKQLNDKKKSIQNYTRSHENTRSCFNKASRNTSKYKSANKSSNFTLERRKQHFTKYDFTNRSVSGRPTAIVHSNKDVNITTPSTSQTSNLQSSQTGISHNNGNPNDEVTSTKSSDVKIVQKNTTTKTAMETALLSARLSSLSSSIASAKSKLQANRNMRLPSMHFATDKPHQSQLSLSTKPIKGSQSLKPVTANIRPSLPSSSSYALRKAELKRDIPSSTLSSSPSLSSSLSSSSPLLASLPSSSSTPSPLLASSSLLKAVNKVDSTKSNKDTNMELTKNQRTKQLSTSSNKELSSVSNSSAISKLQGLHSKSSFSWKKNGSVSNKNISHLSSASRDYSKKSTRVQNQSKPSAFTWKKEHVNPQTSSVKTTSIPAVKSKLKWSKEGKPKDISLANIISSTPSGRSKHVWRAKGSLKIDRRKRTSTGSLTGFMKRRQKVVKKTTAKKASTSSRYHFVNTKRRKLSSSEKSDQVMGIEGETSGSTVDTKATPKNAKQKSSKLLNISGDKYIMDASRKTLRRVSKDQTSNSRQLASNKRRSSLKKVLLGGVTFIETAPGVLVRSITPAKKTLASQLRRRSVQNALLHKYKKKAKSSQYCMFYNRFGKCNKGAKCPYIHDPSKVAVCTKFLQGQCDKTDGSCPFSHQVDQDKMPVCQFFLQDKCTNEDCPYSHVHVSSNAAVCQDFVKGYCPLGKQCKKKHILDCEEYQKTGKCSKGKKCNLLHKKQKTRKRKRKPSKDFNQDVSEAKEAKTLMAEEEGFLPLETTKESCEKRAEETRTDIDSREKVKHISIKPQFLSSKDNDG